MNSKLFGAAAAALILASTVSTGAFAQARGRAAAPVARTAAPATAAPAPAPANIRHGPALPGICIVSYERAIGESNVGKAAGVRMQQLIQQAGAELNAEQTTLQNDANTLNTQRASLTQDQLQQRATALQTRADAFDRKRAQRQQEIELTTQKVRQRIGAALSPIVISAYQSHNCSLLVNGDSVLAANPAMDLTPGVVQQLNAQMSTITFDREQLPANAAPAQH